MATPAGSLLEHVARTCKCAPRVVPAGGVTILHVDAYPRSGLTTLVTMGLAVHERSMYRRLPIGFELTATISNRVDEVHELLAAAALDDLAADARGDAHQRVCALPPRGVMDNGVYAASHAPHLLFATDLTLTPAFVGRHRVGSGYVSFLSAIPITSAELEAYDSSPAGLVARLRGRAGLDDVATRMESGRR